MPLSYDFIEKPVQVQAIDEFFSGSAEELREAYAYARRVLEGGGSLDQTTDALAAGDHPRFGRLTDGDAGHFRDHWLDPERGLHPWSGPEVGEVMRKAYLDAVAAASSRKEPVPIETFWVFSPVDEFEMRVSESDHAVTVFALIPKTDEIAFDAPPDENRIRRHTRSSRAAE